MLCQYCGLREVPPRNRKCCENCSPQASKLWKRQLREECRRLGVSYRYHEDPERRRARHRDYMRRRRALEARRDREPGSDWATPGNGIRWDPAPAAGTRAPDGRHGLAEVRHGACSRDGCQEG